MKTAKEFVEHYNTSGQLKFDLQFLELEDNEKNATLLEVVVWSMVNHVVSALSNQAAQ